MSGRPLRDLELVLRIDPTKLKTCDGARKFVIRIVPSLAHACSLPALLRHHSTTSDESEAGFVPPQLAQLAHCVRHGFDSHEMAALDLELRHERLSRVMVHQRFKEIQACLDDTPEDELGRVPLNE